MSQKLKNGSVMTPTTTQIVEVRFECVNKYLNCSPTETSRENVVNLVGERRTQALERIARKQGRSYDREPSRNNGTTEVYAYADYE